MRTTRLAVAFALMITGVSAQNLVKNPGFEASDQLITPWTIRKGDLMKFINPRVVKQAKVGTSDDNAFQFGASSTDLAIEQQISIPKTGYYIVNVASRWTLTSLTWARPARGILGVLRVNGATVQTFVEGYGPDPRNSNWPSYDIDYLPVRPRIVQLTAGTVTLQVLITLTNVRDTITLDDIVVVPVSQGGPFVNLRTSTSYFPKTYEGFNVSTSTTQANIPIMLYAAMQRLSKPLQIPGFTGLLELDPFRDGGLILVASGLQTAGAGFPRKVVSQLGRTIYFQAVEANVLLQQLRLGARMSARVR